MVKLHHEMTATTLHKIGLKKENDDHLVSQVEEEGVHVVVMMRKLIEDMVLERV